jgi:hypothetical protein
MSAENRHPIVAVSNWQAVAFIVAFIGQLLMLAYSYGRVNQRLDDIDARLTEIGQSVDRLESRRDADSTPVAHDCSEVRWRRVNTK